MNNLKFFIEFLKGSADWGAYPQLKVFCQGCNKRMPLVNAETVVEYGAGEGVVTRRMLKEMPKNSELIAIDTNAELVKNLKKSMIQGFEFIMAKCKISS